MLQTPGTGGKGIVGDRLSHAVLLNGAPGLPNPGDRRAYLDGRVNSRGVYATVVRRYAKPLGLPIAQPGDEIGPAYADIILHVPARREPIHPATAALEAPAVGVLSISGKASESQSVPSLPNQFLAPPTPPSSAEPFVLTLGAVLPPYGTVLAILGRREGPTPRLLSHGGRGDLTTRTCETTVRLARIRHATGPKPARRVLTVLVDGRLTQNRSDVISKYTFEQPCALSRHDAEPTAWISPIDKMLSMRGLQILTLCRVVSLPSSGAAPGPRRTIGCLRPGTVTSADMARASRRRPEHSLGHAWGPKGTADR